MAYVDISTLMTIATGQPLPAAVVQQIRDNEEFMIDPPACSIKETTAQSIATGTSTALTSNEENFDNDSMHSTSSNTSRITIQTSGRYLLVSTLRWASDPTGYRQSIFRVDGTDSYTMSTVNAVGSGSVETISTASKLLVLTAGQYVEALGRQNSGGPLDCNLDEFAAYFLTR